MSLATGIILSFTAAFAWGSSMVAFKVGVKDTDPLNATYIKGILAVPLLLLIGLVSFGSSSYSQLFVHPNYFWLIGAIISIAFGDFFSLFALKKIKVSIAQPITAIYPLFTNLTLFFTKKEDINWLIIVGTVIIISGIMFITYFSQRNSNTMKIIESLNEKIEKEQVDKSGARSNSVRGIILSFLAAIFWGLTIFFTKLLLDDPQVEVIPMMGIRNGLMVVVAAFFVLTRYFIRKDISFRNLFAPKKDALFLIGGGALAWCVGGVSFFTAVRQIGAGISTPLSSISPFIVILLGIIFLKEKLTRKQFVGIFLIIAGTILLSLKDLIP